MDFNPAHDLGHARLFLDDVREDIDFLETLRKEINIVAAPTEEDDYEGFDVLIPSAYPSIGPSISLSGEFGVGKTTAITAVVGSFRASAIALVDAKSDFDILAATEATSSRFTPISREELARLEAQRHAEGLKKEIARQPIR